MEIKKIKNETIRKQRVENQNSPNRIHIPLVKIRGSSIKYYLFTYRSHIKRWNVVIEGHLAPFLYWQKSWKMFCSNIWYRRCITRLKRRCVLKIPRIALLCFSKAEKILSEGIYQWITAINDNRVMDELLVRPWVCEFDRDRGTIHNRNQVTRFSSQRSSRTCLRFHCKWHSCSFFAKLEEFFGR